MSSTEHRHCTCILVVRFRCYYCTGIVPVNDPFEAGVGARCSSGYSSAAVCSDVALDVQVREEGCVNIGAGCSTAAEVHRVWPMETLASVFCLDVARVLPSLTR